MISEGDCRAKGEANWLLAQDLASTGNYDWAITVAFYAALHHVNALLVRASKYADDLDHPTRQEFLRRAHPAIEVRYSYMFSKSIRTRYEVSYQPDEDAFFRQAKGFVDIREYVTRVMAGAVPGV